MNEKHHLNKETTLKLQLHEMGLFHTPKSMDEIVQFIDNLPSHEQATAWTVFGLYNNLVVDRLRNDNLMLAEALEDLLKTDEI